MIRKLFVVFFMSVLIFLVGCGNDENKINEFRAKGRVMILRAGSYCAKDVSDIKTLSYIDRRSELFGNSSDDIYRQNFEKHLERQQDKGLILYVTKDTRVTAVFDSANDAFPDILFEEGEYNKRFAITKKENLLRERQKK